MAKNIKLGSIVRDRISGFKGVAFGRHEYLTGCNKITVQPQELKDGKPLESQWFDEQQLEVVEEAKPSKFVDEVVSGEAGPVGGPADEPRRAL